MLLICLLATVIVEASVSLPCDTTALQREAITQKVTSNLEKQGWTVKQGEFKFLQNTTAFGANPGNPYGVYYQAGRATTVPVFRLAPGEIVLNLACTPPQSLYYSYRSYVFMQGIKLLFASLGDSANNLVMNATQMYGGTTAVLTTADSTSLTTVTQELEQAGLPRSAVTLDAIPSELIDMKTDSFVMLHRASVFQDQTQKEQYYNSTWPIYFLTPPINAPFDPLPVLPLRKPGTGQREQDIPGLVEGLQQLNTTMQGYFKDVTLAEVLPFTYYPLDGFTCIKQGTDCLGDNHDTHYLHLGDKQEVNTLGPRDVWVVFGTNNVATGKCTYNNIGLYKAPFTSTPLSVDFRKWNQSAALFCPSLPASVSKDLFVYLIARDCSLFGGRFCLEVPEEEIPLSVGITALYRTYLEPATKTAPDINEIVMPTLFRFVAH